MAATILPIATTAGNLLLSAYGRKQSQKATEEAQELLKQNKVRNKDLLEGLHSLGPNIVVITDKNRPIQCFDGKKVYSIKPNPIKVVERTGAGDAFASGFVAGLIADKPIEYCLSLGLKEGESVIRHFGAKNNLLRMNIK